MSLPDGLCINAYTGAPSQPSPLSTTAGPWVGRQIVEAGGIMRPSKPPASTDWRHPNVGWGLVLRDDEQLTPVQRATAVDAPEPIQRLLADRGGPVLRWSPALPRDKLRHYDPSGSARDPHIVSAPRGIATGCIPRYLLMYGDPDKLPWELQYRLNAVAYTGRLALTGAALDRYVTALIDGWSTAGAFADDAVIWAVDHGAADITRLMRGAVAFRLSQKLLQDPSISVHFIDGQQAPATASGLIGSLANLRPGLVVTSSHGMTGPLGNPALMRAQLGLPVDALHGLLQPTDLLEQWQPDGAIWHAQACCSAGSVSHSAYDGLVAAGSDIDRVLKGVAALGNQIAPLPQALLGADKPLRAFIGHVEPTFDWTLRDPQTGQILTSALISALYDQLFQPYPVGLSFEECHAQGPRLESIHRTVKTAFNAGDDRLEEALAARLVAQDLESLVILGDPTVVMRYRI